MTAIKILVLFWAAVLAVVSLTSGADMYTLAMWGSTILFIGWAVGVVGGIVISLTHEDMDECQ